MVERKNALFQTRAELLRRLMLAEVIARRGEGPLALRFSMQDMRRAARASLEAKRTESEP
jgi:hypothetical protein